MAQDSRDGFIFEGAYTLDLASNINGGIDQGFAYLGNYLDHKWLTKTPYWTAGLLLLGVIISFVVVFRALKKMNNES